MQASSTSAGRLYSYAKYLQVLIPGMHVEGAAQLCIKTALDSVAPAS